MISLPRHFLQNKNFSVRCHILLTFSDKATNLANIRKYISSIFVRLAGSPGEVSLEGRIFHFVVIVAVLTAVVNMLVNFLIGLVFYGIIVMPLICILIYGFYLSRYRNSLPIAVSLCALTFNVICGITYFGSEGSSSVNLFTFILIIFILSFICSKKQAMIWVPLTILHVLILLIAEWNYPHLARPLYQTHGDRLVDVAQTWVEVAVMIAVITMMIRSAYQRQKDHAQNNLARLQRANDAKTRLFSIISHDLRAPLSNIEQYLSLISDSQISEAEKKTIELQLKSSTTQTSEMLNNILAWSKHQMSGSVAKTRPIVLAQLLKSTIFHARIIAQEKHIEIIDHIPAEIMVSADPDMLQMIVRNLVHNAIKFSYPNGKIMISSHIEDQFAVIQVSDNGVGITEKADELFSENYRSTYGTGQEKGVGLGLLLAREYTLMQKGKIWFESAEGKGTTFSVSLPLTKL